MQHYGVNNFWTPKLGFVQAEQNNITKQNNQNPELFMFLSLNYQEICFNQCQGTTL